MKPLLRIAASRASVKFTSTYTAAPSNPFYSRAIRAFDAYEEFIGIKAVKEAQAEVMEWEQKLSDAQMLRRNKQTEIKSVQRQLKDIHLELDRTSRGEDRFLHLLTEEHAAIKKERSLLETFESLETAEREAFHELSNKVRSSHERERERAEKTKWWGVSASLIGALIGIIGTSIGNELRMRRLREMLPLGGAQMSEMAHLVSEQNNKVTSFIGEMREALKIGAAGAAASESTSAINDGDIEKVVAAIRSENDRLTAQMNEITRMARLEASLNADPNAVVYVGSDMERLLDQTEKNLESKMKLQTLMSVVFLYTALGVTVPLIFAFIRGN